MSSNPQVVITGATGLIAKHTIAELLKRGHPVLGTVRNMNRTDDVRRAVSRAGADPASLNFARADLLSDDDWDVALEGAEVVLHMASPFPIAQPDDPDDVIRPARDGTLRVLKAATRAKVKRVVLTSSSVAIFYGSGLPAGHIYSEADFTDETRNDLTPYIKSKTIAEKAAWHFIKSTPGAPELAVINPMFRAGSRARRRSFDFARTLSPDGARCLPRRSTHTLSGRRRARRCRSTYRGSLSSRGRR